MPRPVRNPQALIEQLLRLLPHAAPSDPPPGPGTEERIIDAALAAFTANGIRATTMSQIARDAGISREWLYKHFRNRDAVVVAVTRREAVRFIDGLVARGFQSDDVVGALTEAFVYSVEFLRDHALLQRILTAEADVISTRVLREAAPVVGIAVQTGASYLSGLGDVDPDKATVVAETLVRLVASIIFAPSGLLNFHDPDQLRRYAETVVPAVLTANLTPASQEH